MTADQVPLPGETSSPDVSLPVRDDAPRDPHPIYDELAEQFAAPAEEHAHPEARHAADDTAEVA